MAFHLGPNRRINESATWYNKCRCCWQPLTLDPEKVEVTEQYTYYRCPHCGYSFPMRRGDAEAFGQATSS